MTLAELLAGYGMLIQARNEGRDPELMDVLAEARLRELAPDLARLALDMGEWIADQSCVGADRAAYCDIVCESCREPVALLARLDGIAGKDKTT